MMKYGAEPAEHSFVLSCREVEQRGQWLDIYLNMTAESGSPFPAELNDPAVLVICSANGTIVQVVLHNEGCDCEFQFTLREKEQIERFVAEHDLHLPQGQR